MNRRELFRFGGMAAAAAGVALAMRPTEAEAATNFLWEGAGTYGVSVANLLTTQLNALANSTGNVLSTLGGATQNTTGRIYADVEFVAGGTFSPTAGGFIELWLLRSLDGGSTYEDGSATVAPGRAPDIVIPVEAGTTITPRNGASGLVLPPAFFKPLARNQTGATLPASGNLIRFALYTEQF